MLNSTGHSDYNIPAYVQLFRRKQITMILKKEKCFIGVFDRNFVVFIQLWFSQSKLQYLWQIFCDAETNSSIRFMQVRRKHNQKFRVKKSSSPTIYIRFDVGKVTHHFLPSSSPAKRGF